MAGPACRPKALPCENCGKLFFPKSLPFHQKVCIERRQKTEAPCPYCQKYFPLADLKNHLARGCKGLKNQDASVSVGEDGLIPCTHCGRTFSEDRIAVHVKICGKLRSARPKGPRGENTQAVASVYCSSMVRTSENGKAFCSLAEFNARGGQTTVAGELKGDTSRQDKEQRVSKAGFWRRQHEDFIEGIRAARRREGLMPAGAFHGGGSLPSSARHGRSKVSSKVSDEAIKRPLVLQQTCRPSAEDVSPAAPHHSNSIDMYDDFDKGEDAELTNPGGGQQGYRTQMEHCPEQPQERFGTAQPVSIHARAEQHEMTSTLRPPDEVSSAPPPEEQCIGVGMQVRVIGLGKAVPANGKIGTIVKEAGSGRWVLNVDGERAVVREANMQLM
eukprot:gnl/MRDRNA2_/MRDRNA2_63795_c0_seq1.p1 gnl/MRDRNA2_/MRDRNA2_63795_c0~~gnl/MRDRNA2_/MRDRNA2_63795_c0_seq1.p1  ORF type:complete len:387 (-),score=63.94 gnl/MRDRNA2_/MRDRNA2_63795_c0_seq1:52-1212(-)